MKKVNSVKPHAPSKVREAKHGKNKKAVDVDRARFFYNLRHIGEQNLRDQTPNLE